MIYLVPCIETVKYGIEKFPHNDKYFQLMFSEHGREVRGKPLRLDFARYHKIESEKRLVWVVARSIETNNPIGYSLHYWYTDLHECGERAGTDDLWYVDKEFRKKGIGRTLKQMGHAELKRHGCITTSDNIRGSFHHDTLMYDLGFQLWGVRWKKTLSDTLRENP